MVQSTSRRINFAWLGAGLAVTDWLLETLLHTYLLDSGSFVDNFLPHDANELWMRIMIMALIIGAGILVEILMRRHSNMLIHMQKLNRLLTLLSNINQVVQRHMDPKLLLNSACKATVDIGGFRIAWIGLQEGSELKLATWAVADPELEDVIRQMKESVLGSCLGAQCVFQTGESTLCELRKKAECHAPWLSSAIEHGCEHAIAIPLKINNKTVGVFEVYAGGNGQFSEDERSILDEVADDISVALTNIEHEKQRLKNQEKLRERLDELERFQKATMQREGRIKELRGEVDSLQAKLDAKNSEPEA